MHPQISRISYAPRFTKAMERCRKRDSGLFQQAESQAGKVMREPECGKPLRHDLKNHRRVHVGHFVILYTFQNGLLEFLDFDHHDKIYKKYS